MQTNMDLWDYPDALAGTEATPGYAICPIDQVPENKHKEFK
jgi:hypothetical protein